MRVGELFAGIGGFGLAAQRAGCVVAWACELDDFASRVYGARFPDVPVHPDVRDFVGEPVDCITAGFPCQDLSVAGKRKGLVGERSGLFWEIIRIAGRLRPRWLLLENVPGLLSSHRGRDFETVLAALDECGYGVAWRVLDAQFFGVPQRRRRVFIVGHLGGPCPAEVLFESEGVSGDSAPRRSTGEDVAKPLGAGADRRGWRGDLDLETYAIQERAVSEGESGPDGKGWRRGAAYTLESRHRTQAVVSLTTQPDGSSQGVGRGGPVVEVAHSLTGEGFDAGEDGTGRGTPIVPSVVSNGDAHSGFRDEAGVVTYAIGSHAGAADGDVSNRSHASGGPVGSNVSEEMAYSLRGGRVQNVAPTVAATLNPGHEAKHSYAGDGGTLNIVGVRPRRLTPRECERLQGFPDDWTLIDGASDSARYRALGNAVAVPVVEWIMHRLARSSTHV